MAQMLYSIVLVSLNLLEALYPLCDQADQESQEGHLDQVCLAVLDLLFHL